MSVRVALLAPLISPIREPQIGGVATLITDLARELQQAGVDVDLFAASGSQLDLDEAATTGSLRLVDTGVDSAGLAETLFRPMDGPLPAAQVQRREAIAGAAYEQAYAMIADGAYDVVHSHAFDAPAIELALGLAPAVVHTLHLPPDRAVSQALLVAAQAGQPPIVAAVSPSQRQAWQAFNAIDLLLPAGVPTARIPWSERSGSHLLFAGRLSPEKGVLEAIEIAGGTGRELLIAGGRYDPAYADQVQEAALQSGAVRLIGALPRTTLWQEMARAAAFIFPILWDEPFGMVTAEAQAAGCPVIGFGRGALPDVVADGRTGAVVAPGDVGAARRALGELGSFPRAACRRHAEEHLDVAPMIQAHLALYRDLARA